MSLFKKGDDGPIEYPAEDDEGMPRVGRLWFEPGATWWGRCRWCNAVTWLRFRSRISHIECVKCDSPDRGGKSPFEVIKGDE